MQTIELLSKPTAPSEGVFGTEFIQQLSAFGEQHRKAAEFDDEKLTKYIDRKFEPATLGESKFINIDDLPPAIRQFVELQNRIAGLDVGRSGMDSFHPEEQDAAFGFETTAQRLKREGRERWFRWFILTTLAYTQLYEDTYKMYRNAREAVKKARKAIDEDTKRVAKEKAATLMLLKRDNKEHILTKQERKNQEEAIVTKDRYKARLDQEKEDLLEYEEQVLEPAEKKLNESVTTEEELNNIQRNLTRTMPGRAWRSFQSQMNNMKNKFNSFPRMFRREERENSPNLSADPTPVNVPPPPKPTKKMKVKKAQEAEQTEGTEENEEPENIDEPGSPRPENNDNGPDQDLD